MGAAGIVALVAGALLVVAVPVTALVVVLRRRGAANRARFMAELATDPAVRGPERAVYRGSTGGYPQVQGNGQIALTRTRLRFAKSLGVGVDVSLTDITAVRTARSFNRSVVSGQLHLVVATTGGEVGYFVADTQAWVAALTEAAELSG